VEFPYCQKGDPSTLKPPLSTAPFPLGVSGSFVVKIKNRRNVNRVDVLF